MATSRKLIHYAPGSNRVTASAKSVSTLLFDDTPSPALGGEQRLVIQQRLRRRFLEEDGTIERVLPAELAPGEISVLARLHNAMLGRPFFRPSLKLTRLS